jgi:hypothetical protein
LTISYTLLAGVPTDQGPQPRFFRRERAAEAEKNWPPLSSLVLRHEKLDPKTGWPGPAESLKVDSAP